MPQWLREVMQSVADSPEVIEHYVRDFFMS
jgi:hypothetical protein